MEIVRSEKEVHLFGQNMLEIAVVSRGRVLDTLAGECRYGDASQRRWCRLKCQEMVY